MKSIQSLPLLALSLALSPTLALAQGAASETGVPHRPSRDLPTARTVLTLEAPEPSLLWEMREALFQVRAFDSRTLRRTLEQLGHADDAARARAKLELLAKFFSTYDRGLTLAAVFDTETSAGGTNFLRIVEPWTCLIGASSDSSKVRELPELVHAIVKDRPAPEDATRVPLLDTPVYIRSIDDRVFDAYRARRGAMVFSDRANATNAKGAAAIAGECLGLVRRSKPRLHAPAPADERVLLRARYTPAAIDSRPESWLAKFPAARSFLGVDALRSVDGRLSLRAREGAEPELIERIDVHPNAGAPSVLDALRHDAHARATRVAQLLPADTIAFATVRLDGKNFGEQLDAITQATGFAPHDLMDQARAFLGLEERPGASLEEIEGMSVALTPSREGAAEAPDYILFVHGKLPQNAAGISMGNYLEQTPSSLTPQERRAKVRDEGGALSVERRALEPRYRSSTPGFAVAKRGDTLMITAQRAPLARALAQDAATSLASEARFAEDLRGRAARAEDVAAYGFVDCPRLLRASLSRRARLDLPLLWALPQMDEDDAEELAKLAARERFFVVREEGFHRFEHEGGTLFSPIAWSAVGGVAYLARVLSRVPQKRE